MSAQPQLQHLQSQVAVAPAAAAQVAAVRSRGPASNRAGTKAVTSHAAAQRPRLSRRAGRAGWQHHADGASVSPVDGRQHSQRRQQARPGRVAAGSESRRGHWLAYQGALEGISISLIPLPFSVLLADSASPSCDSPVCKSFFGIFVRRHHCRHCGHVFCSSHTPYTIPLDQNARFHPDGIPSRSCDLCWAAYRRWEQARADRLNQIQHNLLANLNAPERSQGWAIEADRLSIADPDADSDEHQDGMIATSVPRDWSWSTF
ncbi:hypothetical protein MGYG_07283 [Nannizzia gypsea CBS 118893]|uniref:FYVE-type domain-containing protein n=1 Tax=Arthroderma gypseum (strain ATCC MYA-4604 / CBS 118893) TaxID=535722 RepID=E4V2K9_ARTGP|nr:hypothetical protein MGYG_07283 [Nannizzia gypsea CBS 118893]EFR04274.1 hypothetical protein MGYG_07283 [Nannizzia gypsea CBS 118893]